MGLGQHGSGVVGPGFESLSYQNFYDFKLWHPLVPLLLSLLFGYQNFCETQKGSPTKGSLLWDIKFSMENFDTPSPFLSIKFSDTRIFLKHRNVPLRNCWLLWDKKFPTENRDIPLFCIKFFDTRS